MGNPVEGAPPASLRLYTMSIQQSELTMLLPPDPAVVRPRVSHSRKWKYGFQKDLRWFWYRVKSLCATIGSIVFWLGLWNLAQVCAECDSTHGCGSENA